MSEKPADGAFVVVWDSHNLLLVHHNYGQRKWSLPGGGIEPNETPETAGTRETLEETGQVVVVTHRLGIFQLLKSPGVVHLLEAELAETKIHPLIHSPEISRVAFLAPELFWERLYPAQQKLVAWAAYLKKMRSGGSNNRNGPCLIDLIHPPHNPLFLPLA